MGKSAERMFDYLTGDKRFTSTNIILHGYSLGAPIAAHVSTYAQHKEKPVGALFLDRPMPSLNKAAWAKAVGTVQTAFCWVPSWKLGCFSVERNLIGYGQGSLALRTDTKMPILLYTDKDELGPPGETLRKA